MLKEALNQTTQGTIITIKVIPNSKKFDFTLADEWTSALKFKIINPAQKGKANEELVEKLSKIFKTKAKIVSGQKNSKKLVLLKNLKKEQVIKTLENLQTNSIKKIRK